MKGRFFRALLRRGPSRFGVPHSRPVRHVESFLNPGVRNPSDFRAFLWSSVNSYHWSADSDSKGRPKNLLSPVYFDWGAHRDDDLPEIASKWHITKEVLPKGWSTNWTSWHALEHFFPKDGCRPSTTEQELNILHKIQDPIKPLAYYGVCDCEARYAFFADGKYYLYYTGMGELFSWDIVAETFASHDDFLRSYWASDTYPHGLPKTGMTHILRIEQDQEDIYGGYLPPGSAPFDPSLRVVNPPRRYVGRLSARELSKKWHRQEALPANWSCDWENWPGILNFFIETTWYNLSRFDMVFRGMYNICGKVEPLAFCPHSCGSTFLFAAAGDYYYYSSSAKLYRYEGQFASHADFLARVEGASRVRFPKMAGDQYEFEDIDYTQKLLRTADWLRRFERAS
ncbi:hypothetical protein B0H19DRAFT_1172181 [Mycena capillaripes]|nr:hypothetical protein B0H19DRAFT_1172181 [Mycena capillaripes]